MCVWHHVSMNGSIHVETCIIITHRTSIQNRAAECSAGTGAHTALCLCVCVCVCVAGKRHSLSRNPASARHTSSIDGITERKKGGEEKATFRRRWKEPAPSLQDEVRLPLLYIFWSSFLQSLGACRLVCAERCPKTKKNDPVVVFFLSSIGKQTVTLPS